MKINYSRIIDFAFFLSVVFFLPKLIELRNAYYLTNPQFYAEDAVIFYKQAVENGISSLFIPFAGYLHLIPRVIAFASLQVDITQAPAFFSYGVVLVMALLITYLWFLSNFTTPMKIMVVGSLFFLISSNDVYGFVVNLHWHLPILLLLIFTKPIVRPKWEYFVDFFVLFVVGLTGPFSVVLLPIIIFLFLANKFKSTTWGIALFTIYLITVVVQIAFLLAGDIERTQGIFNLNIFIKYTAHFTFSCYIQLSTIFKLVKSKDSGFHWFIIISILIWTTIQFFKSKDKKYDSFAFAVASFLMILSTMYSWKNTPQYIVPPFMGGWRYTHLPTMFMFLSFAFVLFNKKFEWLKLTFIILYFYVSFKSSNKAFEAVKFQDLEWKRYSTMYKQGELCEIPIQPIDWKLKFDSCEVK